MPRPRFERLAADKRTRILEAAAQEFAAHGYENASLNKILEAAGISKGAAYYYFDDKEDLYTTTLRACLRELSSALPVEVDQFGEKTFWSEVAALYRQQFAHFYERPWILSMAKAGGPASTGAQSEGLQGALQASTQGLLTQIVEHGQNLGTVRQDLPADLLQALLVAVDAAHDRWLYARWAELSPTDIEGAADRIADTLQRLLAPKVASPRKPLWWRWATKIAPHILRGRA